MTAGMAAARPAAVVTRASEIPGATARNVAAPAVPSPWKASMIPQTVPNRPMNGVTAPVIASQRHIAFEAGNFLGRCDLHGALNGGDVVNAAGGSHLALELRDRAVEDSDQRAGTKLLGHGSDVLQALRFAERADKTAALSPGRA